ncbi:hypothetical protein [Simiduia agarivorans]|uniref:Uncharacterized protein n=1 Tax=Simiduia agarivorans (strain DSM 21679 / JCM 13881 / BCRC 17597 / SA1) TaxID=1117647 RepID=K4KJ98_SIMAS|nr:hypothetical protein [Simiduia agarivorans]AFU99199.1 hypothetical protein M5M_10090 [Simiduia agarivorans SA1 = DSM 21679]
MKWTLFAVIAQSCLLVFVYFKLDQVSRQHAQLAAQVGAPAKSELACQLPQAVAPAESDSMALAQLQSDLRQLIDSLQRQQNVIKPQVATVQAPTEQQIALQRRAQDKLNALIYSGPVSQAQFEALQIEAAQLHPEQRKQMFSDIARAVNSGQLELAN